MKGIIEIMLKVSRSIFILSLITFFTFAANAEISVKVKFHEIANLTYQLDCVGNLPINCSGKNLGELWQREFLKTAEDREMLREWKRLRELYSRSVQINQKTGEGINLFDKLRIAGLQAVSVEDYMQRLDLLINPADRQAFERVVRYFYPRFKIWWRQEASKAGAVFSKETDKLLRSPKIAVSVRQFFDFYSPALPEVYELSFNLLYIPSLVKEPFGGQQLQNYSLMEFKANERPAQRIDVAVHELCHFFYDNLSPEKRSKLEQNFFSTNSPAATPAYNLLNETLAAAFGNGMIARIVTPPAKFKEYIAVRLSFYNNEAIDRAAKAVLPMLDDWLKNKRSLSDAEFVNRYISALEKSLGEDLLKPKLYLSEMFLFVDAKYGVSMRRETRRTLETASLYASEGSLTDDNLNAFKSQPRLNAVFIVHPDNIAGLSQKKIITREQEQKIRGGFAANGAVLFAAERAPFIYVFIIVAKDSDGVTKAIEKLAGAEQFKGVYQEK